ncbi:MAG: hypothetical protein LUE90_09380 [Clostridiales bacterium]|nr:hypothetical protein [Clostridiales bacterium]
MNDFNGWKKDGFKDERLIVLPIESFSEYVSHPQIRRLYLTDVGFFPALAATFGSARMA